MGTGVTFSVNRRIAYNSHSLHKCIVLVCNMQGTGMFRNAQMKAWRTQSLFTGSSYSKQEDSE
jgi:hypothetical protein